MERKFRLRGKEDEVLVCFSGDVYFCLNRTAQNEGQESTPAFPLRSREVLLVRGLLAVSRLSKIWLTDPLM